MATTRHNWLDGDICVRCGLRRSGYSGGRTGSMQYTTPTGEKRDRAGSCAADYPLLKAEKGAAGR